MQKSGPRPIADVMFELLVDMMMNDLEQKERYLDLIDVLLGRRHIDDIVPRDREIVLFK